MEYAGLIRILVRRWWLIVLPVVVSAVITIPEFISGASHDSSGFTAQIRYSAAQKLDLSQRQSDYTDVWLASEHTVDALTDWVRSSSFRAEIQAQLGADNASIGSLQIAADNARTVGLIYLSHNDADALRRIAEAILIVLGDRNQIYFPQLGGETAQVTILDQPEVSAIAPALMTGLTPLIRLGVAFMIGLALAFFAEYIDPTIYHQDDLRRLGMTLVGSIPRDRA